MMMMTMITRTLIPIAHILQFFHQYFLFNLAALVSNCEAPACSASARSSSSESFWSLSNTLSTLTLMMSTTSSTWFCVCWSLRLLPVAALDPEGTPVDILAAVAAANGRGSTDSRCRQPRLRRWAGPWWRHERWPDRNPRRALSRQGRAGNGRDRNRAGRSAGCHLGAERSGRGQSLRWSSAGADEWAGVLGGQVGGARARRLRLWAGLFAAKESQQLPAVSLLPCL